eukprot:SAG31_NODE_20523_length_572_cov_0.832981_1_plen_81_part_10
MNHESLLSGGMVLQNEGFVVELVRLAFTEGLADFDPAQQLATLGESPAAIGLRTDASRGERLQSDWSMQAQAATAVDRSCT